MVLASLILRPLLVNESMVSRMAWKDPIGKKFLFGGGPNGPTERNVAGVIKDYNQNSLYDVIEPLMILLVWFKEGQIDFH